MGPSVVRLDCVDCDGLVSANSVELIGALEADSTTSRTVCEIWLFCCCVTSRGDSVMSVGCVTSGNDPVTSRGCSVTSEGSDASAISAAMSLVVDETPGDGEEDRVEDADESCTPES